MSEPEVVARRFDQLGARLAVLCNAMALAEFYSWNFGLVWPYSKDEFINDPLEIFAPSFLAAHGLEESDLEGRTAIVFDHLSTALSDREILLSGHPERPPFIDVPNPFEVLTAQVEEEDSALARFRRAFDAVEWSDALQPILEFSETWAMDEQWTGMHVRAGDTVDGPWSNGMWHEKYLPTSCLGAALAECRAEDVPVLVCTDHPKYAAWLGTRYGQVRFVEDVFPSVSVLTTIQRAFAEMLLLSRCHRIVGPPRSAFSGLSAMLRCGIVIRADELCPAAKSRTAIEASIDELEEASTTEPFLRPFVARDACWWADVHADEVEATEMCRMLRRATRADPGFAAAWARRARTAARLGRMAEARTAARRGMALAEADQRHDDPSVDALAAQVVVEACGTIGPLGVLVPGSATRCLRRAAAAADACRNHQPYVIRMGKITEDLDALVTTAHQIAELPWGRRLSAARRLRASLRRPLAVHPTGSRHPGVTRRELHRTAPYFDPPPEDVAGILGLFEDAFEQARSGGFDTARRG